MKIYLPLLIEKLGGHIHGYRSDVRDGQALRIGGKTDSFIREHK
jgi:hypothetical protein